MRKYLKGKNAVMLFAYQVSGCATILNTFAPFNAVLLQQISLDLAIAVVATGHKV